MIGKFALGLVSLMMIGLCSREDSIIRKGIGWLFIVVPVVVLVALFGASVYGVLGANRSCHFATDRLCLIQGEK